MRFVLLLALLLACTHTGAAWTTNAWDVMGTRATLEFWCEQQDNKQVSCDAVTHAVRAEFERINALLSPWLPSSELAQVNEQAARHPVPISAEFMQLLQRSAHYFSLTGGAFDITFASAGSLYDYRNGTAPDDAQLAAAQKLIGFRHVVLTGDSVAFTHDGVRIDLGGIAKGYAIDRAIAILREHDIDHAYVSLGGDSYVLGDRRGRDWQVGIRHPRDETGVAIRLPVSDIAVSTSGDYERYFERDGERFHHILNPASGKASKGLVSVTILAPRGTDADALSTSVFVLGKEKGLALANRLDDISAILIDEHGKVFYSDDLAPAGPPAR